MAGEAYLCAKVEERPLQGMASHADLDGQVRNLQCHSGGEVSRFVRHRDCRIIGQQLSLLIALKKSNPINQISQGI